MDGCCFFLVHNTSAAFRAEKVLKNGGVSVKLVPTPRDLSSDCGVAIRCRIEDRERAGLLLSEGRVEVAGIHPPMSEAGK